MSRANIEKKDNSHRCSKGPLKQLWWAFSTNIYLFKVNSRNTRKRCETRTKLTIKTPERRQWRRSWRRSCVFIVNFEHISHLFLVFLLLTLNKQMSAGFSQKKLHYRYFWIPKYAPDSHYFKGLKHMNLGFILLTLNL